MTGRLAAGAALACVLVQIGYPLTAGSTRDAVTVAIVVLAAAAAVVHAAASLGARTALWYTTVVGGLGLGVEILGTATGFPFGTYEYALGRLGPALAEVPLLIPVAWIGGVYPVWIAAGLVSMRWRIPLTAFGVAGWDLYLDPQMVADGQWVWLDPDPTLPGLPDIPVSNFVAWCAVALVMTVLLPRTAPREPAVPVALFCWTWLGSALAHLVFLGLPASALYGLLGMGVVGVPLLRRGLARWPGDSADRLRRPEAPG